MNKLLKAFGIVTIGEMNRQLEALTFEIAKAQLENVRKELDTVEKE